MEHSAKDGRSARLRDFFARYVTARGGTDEPAIVAAFSSVAREDFAGPGPWTVSVPGNGMVPTSDDDVAYLYQDTLVAIDPARGINFGEPSLHARCLAAVAPQPGESVLHVGAGVGYYTALLAELVGAHGRVHGREIEADLAARASANLLPWPQATVEPRSGLDDLPSCDVIYVNAGLPLIPHVWLAALKPCGRLIMPLQPHARFGVMLLVTRAMTGASWPATIVTPAGFIGCRGGEDREAERRLTRTLDRRDWKAVRSLRLAGVPDKTAWLEGEGWWLSTAEP